MAQITEYGKLVFGDILTELGERVIGSTLTEYGERTFGGVVAGLISPSSIGSGEAMGATALLYNQVVMPAGLASEEAFGSAMAPVIPSGIESAEAFGSINIMPIQPGGIASGEAFGATLIYRVGTFIIYPASIDSAEAVNEVEFGVFLNFFEYLTEVVQEGGQLVVKKRIDEGTGILVARSPKPAGWFHPWGDELIRLS